MGQILGFIYALFLIISSFGRVANKILIIQTFAFFFKAMHYYLLGGMSGFITSIISLIRNLVFTKIKASKIWTIIFIILFILSGIYYYQGFFCLLPVIATIIYTIIINYDNPKYLRWGMFFTSVAWLIYNIYIISYAGTLIQTAVLMTNILAIIKLDKK